MVLDISGRLFLGSLTMRSHQRSASPAIAPAVRKTGVKPNLFANHPPRIPARTKGEVSILETATRAGRSAAEESSARSGRREMPMSVTLAEVRTNTSP